jgi:hypothetical protein
MILIYYRNVVHYKVNTNTVIRSGDLVALNMSGEAVPCYTDCVPIGVAGQDVGINNHISINDDTYANECVTTFADVEGYFCYEENFDQNIPRSEYTINQRLYCGANGKFTTMQPTSGFTNSVGLVMDTLNETDGILPTGIPEEFEPILQPIQSTKHYMRLRVVADGFSQMAFESYESPQQQTPTPPVVEPQPPPVTVQEPDYLPVFQRRYSDYE